MTQEALLTTELGHYTFSLSDADVTIAATDDADRHAYQAIETKDPFDLGPGAHLVQLNIAYVDHDWDGGVILTDAGTPTAVDVSSFVPTDPVEFVAGGRVPAPVIVHDNGSLGDPPASVVRYALVLAPRNKISMFWGVVSGDPGFDLAGGLVTDFNWSTLPGAAAYYTVSLSVLITSSITQ
jgi:hypothetical protein